MERCGSRSGNRVGMDGPCPTGSDGMNGVPPQSWNSANSGPPAVPTGSDGMNGVLPQSWNSANSGPPALSEIQVGVGSQKKMPADDLRRLAIGVLFAFTFPIALYVASRIWEHIVNRTFGTRPNTTDRRVLASFYLFSPLIIMGMIVQVYFQELKAWWLMSPYLVSACALLFGVVVPCAMIGIAFRIWQGPRWPKARS